MLTELNGMSRTLLIGRRSEEIRVITDTLTAAGCHCERVDGDAAALRKLRKQAFDVVVTDPETTIDEDLALLDELLEVHVTVKTILLAPAATPAEVIAALRARVYVCFTAPYEVSQIAEFATRIDKDGIWPIDIEVLSARPEWVSLRVNCHTLTAVRVVTFLDELHSQVPQALRQDMMRALRQVLLTAMETSKIFNEFKVVEVSAFRTNRTVVFCVRDTASAFDVRRLAHAASAPTGSSAYSHQLGTKLADYATLLADGVVDECITNEIGDEVLLIKHIA